MGFKVGDHIIAKIKFNITKAIITEDQGYIYAFRITEVPPQSTYKIGTITRMSAGAVRDIFVLDKSSKLKEIIDKL